MSAILPGKELHVADIRAIGTEVEPAEIGRTGPAIAYARVRGLPPLVLPAPVFLNRAEHHATFPSGLAVRAPPMICAVQGCFLAGPFGLVCFPDGTLIKQSALRLEVTILTYALEHMKAAFPGRQSLWHWVAEPVASFNGYGTDNYFHFLIDSLGSLHLAAQAPGLAQARRVISGFRPEQQARFPFMGAALTRARIDDASLQPFDGTLLLCQRLLFPKRDSGPTPSRVAHLRSLLRVEPHPAPRRRLYVARPGGWRRRLMSEAQIAAMLKDYGFEMFDPGSVSLNAQIDAFRDAQIVVGPHGAGLTNAAFMNPGGVLLELTHAQRVIPLFHELAGSASLQYGCVIGDMIDTPGQPPLFADFTVEADVVEAAVRAALAAVP